MALVIQVALEEDGNRVRIDTDTREDCDVSFGWVSKAGQGGTQLLEPLGLAEE